MGSTVGNYVTGEDFWGRDEELALFMEELAEGANLLMVAQRRMGKTSLMREAARRLELEGHYLCLYLDVQGAGSGADMVTELGAAMREHQGIWAKTSCILNKMIKGVESVQVYQLKIALGENLNEGNWQEKGDEFFNQLSLMPKPVILFMDEVPILVNRMLKGSDFTITPARRDQADRFMSWLRNNCLRYQGKIRVVVTGSIGLQPVLQQAGLSASVNHLKPFELEPWSEPVTLGFLKMKAGKHKLSFTETANAQVLTELGLFIPYHVQLFFDQIYQKSRRNQITEITSEFVTEVYAEKMLSTQGHAELSHLEERLKLVFNQAEYKLAVDLLTEAAVMGVLTMQSIEILGNDIPGLITTPREILLILEHDGYLKCSPSRGRSADTVTSSYAFNSKLLKDWWSARYGSYFTPTAQRQGVR